MMQNKILNIINFFHLIEELKNVCRSHKTSKYRFESAAEHSWKLAIMALILAPYLDKKIDINKAIKMALIHDIVEVIEGDISIYSLYKDDHKKKQKYLNEKKALKKIIQNLDENNKNLISALWYEFEKNYTHEAKFINALDKLEAQLQQNKIKEIKTLQDLENNKILTKLENLFKFDSFIEKFKNEVLNEASKIRKEFECQLKKK
jgi:putative hydrolase of HD superfamily